MLIKIALFLLIAFRPLEAIIVESSHFSEILNWVERETLVILDIDDTLIIPIQTLGSDIWFQDRLARHTLTCSSRDEALDRALAEWEAVRHLSQMRLVEEKTDCFVRQLQNTHTVMGLTTQGLALANRTVRQLAALDIDLSINAPSSEEHYFMNGEGVLYRKGILFTSGSHKGRALFALLDSLQISPRHLLFINDKETHLKEVENSALSRGIAFIGLRYGFGDNRVANYNSQLATTQWNLSTLSHLLSDWEAEQQLCHEDTQISAQAQ